jgi:ribosomal protein S18 acetylase RimI-like enzyme
MKAMIRVATHSDIATVLELRRGYCRDDHLEFELESAREVTARLLSEPQWGRVMLCEVNGVVVGYVAICIGFSLELGGNEAFIDELFVLPEFRGRGLGRELLNAATGLAKDLGVKALHLEVDQANTAAVELYRALGFVPRDRYSLMTLKI